MQCMSEFENISTVNRVSDTVRSQETAKKNVAAVRPGHNSDLSAENEQSQGGKTGQHQAAPQDQQSAATQGTPSFPDGHVDLTV
jgi:hypothetical protein